MYLINLIYFGLCTVLEFQLRIIADYQGWVGRIGILFYFLKAYFLELFGTWALRLAKYTIWSVRSSFKQVRLILIYFSKAYFVGLFGTLDLCVCAWFANLLFDHVRCLAKQIVRSEQVKHILFYFLKILFCWIIWYVRPMCMCMINKLST